MKQIGQKMEEKSIKPIIKIVSMTTRNNFFSHLSQFSAPYQIINSYLHAVKSTIFPQRKPPYSEIFPRRKPPTQKYYSDINALLGNILGKPSYSEDIRG